MRRGRLAFETRRSAATYCFQIQKFTRKLHRLYLVIVQKYVAIYAAKNFRLTAKLIFLEYLLAATSI